MIHATAVIDPSATIGDNVSIGPYSIIGPDVEIGNDCQIASHVVMNGPTRIGKNNQIYQFASIGEIPQDKKYAGEPTRLEIGDNNVIRESVTINRGTVQGGGITKIVRRVHKRVEDGRAHAEGDKHAVESPNHPHEERRPGGHCPREARGA